MRKLYVPPTGNRNARIAICGEQPGIQEIRHQPPTPFVGPAGKGLDECLLLANISRFDCWITNVIKDLDRPLEHYIDISSRSNRVSEEGDIYINELRDELKQIRPNVVLALGNIPLLALTSRIGVTKWRGSIIESTLISGMKVIPTFHPATFIPPKFNFLNKPLIVFDMKRAKAESEFPEIRRLPRTVKTKPTFNEACAYLKYAKENGKRGATLDIDIEVINEEIDCFSVAIDPYNSMSIPLRDKDGDFFNLEQELEIMRLLATIMEDEAVSKRGANFIFDTQFLLGRYGIRPRGELHCTQIAQRVAFPDFSAGLDFVASMHTDIPYYKEDGKKWLKMGAGSWETWWTYNGMDSVSTAAAHPSQIKDLRHQQNIETYHRQRKLIKPLMYMADRGIKVDVEGMLGQRDSEKKKLDSLSDELNKIVGYYINYNSPAQLKKYFYDSLNIKPYKKKNTRNKWVDTIDVDALKRLARRGIEAARIMLDIRSLSKRQSVYLDIGKVDEDGRYRSSYKPDGAETGRLASGETIFGSGGNQQNWPHDLLRYFTFDKGYIGYSFDLSQIENRIVAYVGGITPMTEAFEKGVDLHRLTASFIFEKLYDEISDKDGSSQLGDGKQSERYWGKKGNHAMNYDLGYKTFALKYELEETEAKIIIERIHSVYPGIRQSYHAMIIAQLKKDRTLTNLFGRRRMFMGPIIPSQSTPESACMKTYREAFAHIPQSSTADKINEQGIEFIYYNQSIFQQIELLTQIHDSVVFQIPSAVPWIDHACMLLEIKKSLETPMYWRGTEIVVPTDLSIGTNMCKEDMVELKSAKIPTDVKELAHKLSVAYEESENKSRVQR